MISTVSPQSRCFVRSVVSATGSAATVGSGGWVCGVVAGGGGGGAGGDGGGGAAATVVTGRVVRTGGGGGAFLRTTGRGAGGRVVGGVGGGGGGGGFGFGATVVGGGGGGGGGGVVGGGGCGTGSGRQCGICRSIDSSGARCTPMSIPMSSRCLPTATTGQVIACAGVAVSTGRAVTRPIAATAPVAALAVRRLTRVAPVRCGTPLVRLPSHPRTGSATGRWRTPTAPACRPARR
jgi:hypothetical protein